MGKRLGAKNMPMDGGSQFMGGFEPGADLAECLNSRWFTLDWGNSPLVSATCRLIG